jgi:two-component system nitrate/nitrite response regulator NarL
MTDTRILILAEDPLARAGLAAMLQNEAGVEVMGQMNPANEDLDPFPHDAAVFDLGWEVDNDLAALIDAPAVELDLPLLLLLPDGDMSAEVSTHLNSMERVASYGLLTRNATPSRVVGALHAVMEGLLVLDPELTQTWSPLSTASPTLEQPVEALTPRESEVLDLLAEGLPNKTIARRLTISEYTVKFHVNAILTKLNASSRTEAVVRATRLGLITL